MEAKYVVVVYDAKNPIIYRRSLKPSTGLLPVDFKSTQLVL